MNKPRSHSQDMRRLKYRQYAASREYDSFYSSAAWKKLKTAFLAQPENVLCSPCRQSGTIKPAKHVHHIVERSIDASKELDWNNLQALCHECHSRLHFRGNR